jgi:hypothetical protein
MTKNKREMAPDFLFPTAKQRAKTIGAGDSMIAQPKEALI